MDAVRRLPIPYSLTYLVLFMLHTTVLHVLSWADGWLPAYSFTSLLMIFPLWLWAPLTIMTYLDSISLKALSGFSPLLDLQPEAMQRLKYEFTTMPARNVTLSSILWGCMYFVIMYTSYGLVIRAYGFGPMFTVLSIIAGLITFVVGSAIYYHTIRQLRLVNRTVRMVNRFDLFRLDPVYAFSTLTARTGVSWILLLSATLLVFPIQLALAPTLALLILQTVLALGAFVMPLGIVNHCLVLEKRRLLAGVDERIKTMLAWSHRCLDEKHLDELDQLNEALSVLNAERQIVARIPTWPWRPGMLTSFLSVLVLPLVIFIIQLAIETWLGK